MPEDPHSQKIAQERVVMEMTGKSRSEIRNDLIDFADRRRLVQRQQISNFRPADSPKIEIRHTELRMPPPLNVENHVQRPADGPIEPPMDAMGRLPFEILYTGEVSGNQQVEVNLDSWLMGDYKPTSKLTITGLGTPHNFGINEAIWMKIEFTPGSAPYYVASIEWGAGADEWWGTDPEGNAYPDPVFWNDPTAANKSQTFLFVPIAYSQAVDPAFPERLVVGSGESQFQIVQVLNTHLRLCTDCYNGYTCKIAVPHWRPTVNN